MRIFLAGSKAFGQAALLLCRERGHTIAGVCCPATTDDGRPDRLYAEADRASLPWVPAGTIRAETLPDGVDLIVAAHSYDFIGKRTLGRARLGGIGYHPSLLPLHRGRDAVRWAIHMGDRITGGTVYWLSDGVDCGPIAAQDWCFVRPTDDAETLWRRDLYPMGLRLLSRTLGDIEVGRLVRVAQDHSLATWEPSWERPPVTRPDLLLLGTVTGYAVTADAGALR